MKIEKLIIYSNALHLEQLITGFKILEKRKIINIEKINFIKPYRTSKINFYGEPYIGVQMYDKNIIFDTSDSFELLNNDLFFNNNITHYFKRSYKIDGYNNLSFKVFPLGFNFLIYSNPTYKFTLPQLYAAIYQKNVIHYIATRNKTISKLMKINNSIYNCNYDSYGNFYDYPKKNIILYNTRLWNPANARNDLERKKRLILNARRLEFVEVLHKYFKNYFVGGIFTDDFSKKSVPKELLIKDNFTYKRSVYFKYLKNSKIGISVNGIHSSGWAIGEYCAFGLGIICDPVSVIVPSDFKNNINYLEASDGLELANACDTLLSNTNNKLKEMVLGNHDYYFNYLSPEKMVLNALLKVIEL